MDTNKLIPLLSEMAVFVQVVESGSFSAAATKLGVAPSSISRSISRLEGALEEKLLERTTRQMRLSATGHQVFNLCRDMLSAAKLAVSAAQVDKATVSGSLRVAAPKAWSRQVLMPHILDFSTAYPQVELQLKVADHYIDPIGDEVDVIIHITETPVAGLIAKTLGSCKLVLCASPSYLAQHGELTHPSELTEHNCIRLGEDPKDCIWEFLRHEEKQSVGIRGSFAVNHSELRREAMLRGMGVTVLPEFTIRDYITSGEVVELLPEWRLLGRYQGQVVAQYAQSKYIPSQIKVFIDFLQSRLVSLAPS